MDVAVWLHSLGMERYEPVFRENAIYHELGDNSMPYPLGNIHPRFWSWYMGASNFTGALGDFLAAILRTNLGGGNHAAALMDRQVVGWCRSPSILTSGCTPRSRSAARSFATPLRIEAHSR
ncbi:hypothetical protein [Paraburkholderia sp. BR14374]|uniref:hypothetical protein n=1 Tax=Paraburkholderia sp. BR14374 TaxID=3237007 RepID=UPI0034CDDB61